MGNMAHADLPHLPFVHGRRAPYFNAFGVHRSAQQRHHVFPAHHRPNPPDLAVDHRQGRTIALAPDQALGAGGHQFAVLGDQPGLRVKIQRGAVQGAAGTLDHANDQVGARARRQSGQRIRLHPRYINGVGEIAGEGFAALGQSVAQLRAKALTFRITAQQGFGHHHQRSGRFDDCVFIRQDLFQGFALATGQGANLQGGNN